MASTLRLAGPVRRARTALAVVAMLLLLALIPLPGGTGVGAGPCEVAPGSGGVRCEVLTGGKRKAAGGPTSGRDGGRAAGRRHRNGGGVLAAPGTLEQPAVRTNHDSGPSVGPGNGGGGEVSPFGAAFTGGKDAILGAGGAMGPMLLLIMIGSVFVAVAVAAGRAAAPAYREASPPAAGLAPVENRWRDIRF